MKRERRLTISKADTATATEVREHFRISENERNDLMIDMGEDFLRTNINWSPSAKIWLRKSGLFWAWFAMQWTQVDIMLADDLGRYERQADIYVRCHRRHINRKLPNYFWRELTVKVKGHEIEADARPV